MDGYRQLCTEVYEIDKPNAPDDALAFYLRYAEGAKGPILEPMAGTGRFLIPLAERGFDIDGTDASPSMLAVSRQKLTDRGLQARLFEGFLDEFEPARTYGLVFIPAGSFCLITDPAKTVESLRRLHAAMSPGSKIVLEIELVTSNESSSWPWGGKWWDRPTGGFIILSWLGNYDAVTQTARHIHRYELVIDGEVVKTEIERFDLRLYRVDEFRELLKSCGFIDVKEFKPYEFVGPEPGADSAIFEATRP